MLVKKLQDINVLTTTGGPPAATPVVHQDKPVNSSDPNGYFFESQLPSRDLDFCIPASKVLRLWSKLMSDCMESQSSEHIFGSLMNIKSSQLQAIVDAKKLRAEAAASKTVGLETTQQNVNPHESMGGTAQFSKAMFHDPSQSKQQPLASIGSQLQLLKNDKRLKSLVEDKHQSSMPLASQAKSTTKRLMKYYCVLINNYLLIFNPPSAEKMLQSSSQIGVGVGAQTNAAEQADGMKNTQNVTGELTNQTGGAATKAQTDLFMPQMHICGQSFQEHLKYVMTLDAPEWVLNLDFARLRVVKDSLSGLKRGFTLAFKSKTHEFTIVNRSKKETQAKGFTQLDNQKVKARRHSEKRRASKIHNNGENKASNVHQVNTSTIELSPFIKAESQCLCPGMPSKDVIHKLAKNWLRLLNRYVVRAEKLLNYKVVSELGSGGQAKVYLIEKRNKDITSAINGGVGVAVSSGTELKKFQSVCSPMNGDYSPKLVETQNLPPQTFALKVVTKEKLAKLNDFQKRQMLREIQVQRALSDCGNVLKILKVHESTKYINLLMEYQEGGSLADLLISKKKMSEEDIKTICAQILLTLDYMNRKGIIHRDLKPENILLNSKQSGVFDVRIADFGYSTFVESSQTQNNGLEAKRSSQLLIKSEQSNSNILIPVDQKIVCGTAGFIAPESVCGKGYTIKSDIFAVGSIVYSLFTLKNLFVANTQNHLMRANKACDLDIPALEYRLKDSGCSKVGANFIIQLLSKDPSIRPSAYQALQHQWFGEQQIPLMQSLRMNKILATKVRTMRLVQKLFDIKQNLFQSLGGHEKTPDQQAEAKFRIESQISQPFATQVPSLKSSNLLQAVSNKFAQNLRESRSQLNGFLSPQRNDHISQSIDRKTHIHSMMGRMFQNNIQSALNNIEQPMQSFKQRVQSEVREQNQSVNYYQVLSMFKIIQNSQQSNGSQNNSQGRQGSMDHSQKNGGLEPQNTSKIIQIDRQQPDGMKVLSRMPSNNEGVPDNSDQTNNQVQFFKQNLLSPFIAEKMRASMLSKKFIGRLGIQRCQ
ncbi:hypothetical protein FGO68_gene14825 [Halteria grandinella]|uniref:Protein kinase domain-containing protein n=1 Tax=Halteria grandinella TaxID=5974 RepID=A0A8J8P393_HALGN|nr:hypothetical protein FGO68_gene14825 [Halteria grandinella]